MIFWNTLRADSASREGGAVQRLISALGSQRAVVLYGAGPSAEIGLPDWTELAVGIADAAQREMGDLPAEVRDDIAAGRYSKAIGEIERFASKRGTDGRRLVEGVVSSVLSDNGVRGAVYDLMARLPVRLFMTTNLDSVFERHLRERRVIPEVFTNARESLEELNPASFDKSVIHIHGSLEIGGRLVLSDSDYMRVMQADEFRPLRLTIESHLVNSSIVILGYSITDPDLRAVARSVAGTVRRNHPVLALLADADSEEAGAFSREFNIEVVPYSSRDGHRELIGMLSTATKWLEAPQVAAVTDEAALRTAQILYVYDAAGSPDGPALVAATKSLVLATLIDAAGPLKIGDLPAAIDEFAGARTETSLLAKAVEDLAAHGLLQEHDFHAEISEAGRERVEVSNRKYKRLWENLSDHARMSVGGDEPVGEALTDVLIDLFSERAAEAVSLALLHQPVETSSMSLFELISQRAQSIGDSYRRLRFVEYVIDMIRRPNSAQLAIIEHLGRSLFCAHAMHADVAANASLTQLIANRALLLDSNLLIPLVACGSPKSNTMKELVSLAGRHGLALCTTHGFAQEVLIHAGWARRYAEENAGDDRAILSAARGFGPYDGNDFLNGMIQTANASGRRIGLHEYLRDCLGSATPTMGDVERVLRESWGIRLVNSHNAQMASQAYAQVETEVREYVVAHASSSKSDTRVRTEAEAFAMVHEWESISASIGLPGDVAVLSSGGYLNRIANDGPRPLNRNVTTTPYALTATISTYLNSGAMHDFAGIVRSEFFNAASDFIEDAELERYFSGVISAADRAYEEDLRPRLLQMEAELIPDDLPDTLESIRPAERPDYVRGLTSVLADYSAAADVDRLRREKREAEQAAEEAVQRADGLQERLDRRKRGETHYQRMMARRKKKP